ncbi:MAG: hypothetical protein Q8L35_08625 [Actinomycetota bacterium]|nr:hypothetical protein [Actinomycetota bacterium]
MAKKVLLTVVIITLLIQAASALAAPAADPAETEIAALTHDIETRQSEIGSLDSQLETTTKDIINTYQKLDGQEDSLNQEKQALNSRLGEVYKNYDDLMIGVFLDARSFNDMWKRFTFLAKINEADTALLQANQLRLEQVRRLKQELARKKQEQIDLKRRTQMEYLQLQASLLQKKALLDAKLLEAQSAPPAPTAPAAPPAPVPVP